MEMGHRVYRACGLIMAVTSSVLTWKWVTDLVLVINMSLSSVSCVVAAAAAVNIHLTDRFF